MTTQKWVYLFDEIKEAEKCAGDWDGVLELLGGKGARLGEMYRLGLSVPPGFVITTEACKVYYRAHKQFPEGMWEQCLLALRELEEHAGKMLGDPQNPLLVSVRSGAKFSMPGMMDTVLNLGLNEETLQGLVQLTGSRRFAYDAYRRLAQMFGKTVLGIDASRFESLFDRYRERQGITLDTDLEARDLEEIVAKFKTVVELESGAESPEDPHEQLRAAIRAVFESWNNRGAIEYRNLHGISHDLGTAVIVQTMVFGNMGRDSGSGVVFTRDPSTGENKLQGEYLLNTQGEDVVAGIRTPRPIRELAYDLPRAYEELVQVGKFLEHHYRDVQDIEFTIERGKLWILQTRAGKPTSWATVKIAVDMVDEGLITREEALHRVSLGQLDQLRHLRFAPGAKEEAVADRRLLAKGIGASPGVAVGSVVFDADTAEEQGSKGKAVILVRPKTNPEDLHGMVYAQGIVTRRGGSSSHAALLARGLNKPCVTGCEVLRINLEDRSFAVGNRIVKAGDVISVEGRTGEIFLGSLATTGSEEFPELHKFLFWLGKAHKRSIWANAAYPRDSEQARDFRSEARAISKKVKWVTEKAKVIELLKLIPREYRILYEVVDAKDKDTLREKMFDVLRQGYWNGPRTCHHPESLGRAPWQMAMTTEEEIEGFLSDPNFSGPSGLGGYLAWLQDPNLREIIVGYEPPKKGLDEYEEEHFVFAVSCHSNPDQVLVEANLGTVKLRSLEEVTSEDLIHIVMLLSPDSPYHKGTRVLSFGRRYLKPKELAQIAATAKRARQHIVETTGGEKKGLLDRLLESKRGLLDRFLESKRGPEDAVIQAICRQIFANDTDFWLERIDEQSLGIRISDAMRTQKFSTEMYQKIVQPKALRIAQAISQKVFDEWWGPPFELPHVMQALDETSGLQTLEAQGRYTESGEVEYMLVYDAKGREESIAAERELQR